MKMRITKIISLLVCICMLININYAPALAEGETSPLQDALYTYIGMKGNEYYTLDDNFAYQRSANNFESSSAMKFLYDLVDVYIDIESKPTEDIYYEELLKSIMYFDSEPLMEVAPDKDLGLEEIVNDCSDSLEIAAGLFKVGNVAKDITEMVGSISDAANLATEVGTEMGDLLQYLTHSYNTYAKFTMLLDGIAENAYNDELRKAAEQLREDIDTSFIYKLSQSEQLLNIGENVTEYTINSNFGNDYFDVSFVEYLDDIDTYIEDANFQSFLKLSSELAMTAITDLTSLGTGFDIGEFIANKIVGFDGLNEKRLEIIAIADISNAAKTFMLDEQLKFLNERDVETANERAVEYIEASIYLVNIHIQGEYSWLELVETDEGILWELRKAIVELFQEDLVNEEWYRLVTGMLVENKTVLKYMLEEQNSSQTSTSNEDGNTIYEELESQALISIEGTWEIDTDYTAMKTGSSMIDLFGSGFAEYGSEMVIGKDNTFKYYIGIGIGGEGTYAKVDNSTIKYTINRYEGGEETGDIKIEFVGDKVYLVINQYGEDIFLHEKQ